MESSDFSQPFLPQEGGRKAGSVNRYELAAVYVNSALRVRNVESLQTDGSSIRAFFDSHDPYFRRLVFLAIFIQNSLIIVEPPASGAPSYLPLTVVGFVEIMCCMIYLYDFHLRKTYMGPKVMDDLWTRVKLGAISLTLLDSLYCCFLSPWFPIPRLSRMLRPFFLAEKTRHLRSIIENIFKTIPTILNILSTLFFFLFMYSFTGVLLFAGSQEGDQYFPNLNEAFYNMFILLTTANYPDVMMPAYNEHGLYVIFFVTFLTLSLYFFMSLILAAVYDNFRNHFRSDHAKDVEIRNKALKLAFYELVGDMNAKMNHSEWRQLMSIVRPDLGTDISDLLFTVLDKDSDLHLNLEEFSGICEYLEFQFQRAKNVQPPETDFSTILRLIVESDYFVFFVSFVLLGNVLSMTFEVWLTHSNQLLATLEWAFSFFYLFEVIIRIYAYSFPIFMEQGWNRFLLILSVFGGVWSYYLTQNFVTVPYQWLAIFRILRLIRILFHLHQFQTIMGTLINITPALTSFLALLYIEYYMYSIIGMELFYGKLKPDNEELQGTTYSESDYWANNFDNVFSSFVVLFELMVVNNWYVTADAACTVTSDWSRIYFISFYLTCVVVIINLIVAFSIEAFIQADKASKRKLGEEESLNSDLSGKAREWVVKKNYQPRNVIKNIFSEEIEDNQTSRIPSLSSLSTSSSSPETLSKAERAVRALSIRGDDEQEVIKTNVRFLESPIELGVSRFIPMSTRNSSENPNNVFTKDSPLTESQANFFKSVMESTQDEDDDDDYDNDQISSINQAPEVYSFQDDEGPLIKRISQPKS